MLAKRLCAVALGTAIGFSLFAGGYEAYQHVAYYRWQSSFTNLGWFGSITVPSLNPKLLWEYKPYGEKAGIRTNRWGFRDRDYEEEARPAGVYIPSR